MESMPCVRDVMNQTVVQIAPSASFAQINQLFSQHNVPHLLVVEQGQPVGIVAEQALHSRAVSAFPFNSIGAALQRETLQAADLMIPVRASVDANASILEAAEIIMGQRTDVLPVLSGCCLVGLLSEPVMSQAMVLYARSVARAFQFESLA